MGFVEGALAVASKVGPNIFPLARIVKIARSGCKITNSTNPLTIGSNVTLTVLDFTQVENKQVLVLKMKDKIIQL